MRVLYLLFILFFQNVIDLVTFLPFWLLLNSQKTSATSFLRVFRCLRIFKLMTKFKGIQAMFDLVFKTLDKSLPVLNVLILLMFLGETVLS